MRAVLSLCDHSGRWSAPYREAGYIVHQVDLKAGQDVRTIEWIDAPIHGVLAAPPCTAFAVSGAQYWPAKDREGETLHAISLVDACLRAVAIYRPHWWALENPVGRLSTWWRKPDHIFDPCDYGDAYTKRTHLWGRFNADLPRSPVEPERVCSQGSWVQRLGGKSERTKVLRSTTPPGFARAFWRANQ